MTRDYTFDIDGGDGRPPVLNVFGGKITTYRRLAEHALDRLAPFLPPAGKPWTGGAALPGGDMADFGAFRSRFIAGHGWLPPDVAHHYARSYGTRAEALLDGARSLADLGRHFGGPLYEREAEFLRQTEWARRHAQDVLERRTKHYLHMTCGGVRRLFNLVASLTQRPLNTGRRFSLNEATPSRRSSVGTIRL